MASSIIEVVAPMKRDEASAVLLQSDERVPMVRSVRGLGPRDEQRLCRDAILEVIPREAFWKTAESGT